MATDALVPVVRPVHDVRDDELDRLLSLLLRAFQDDNAMQTFSGRDKAIESLIYRLTIHHAVRYGKCLVARSAHNASEIYGVAAWAAPGSDWDFHTDPSFLSALDPSLREWFSGHYASKYKELRNCQDVPKKGDGAWALKLLAVAPEARRKGIGKALVDDVLRAADANSESTIVDVRDPSMVHFFQRQGFKYRCVKNVMSQGSPGFPIWRMFRESPVSSAHQ